MNLRRGLEMCDSRVDIFISVGDGYPSCYKWCSERFDKSQELVYWGKVRLGVFWCGRVWFGTVRVLTK
jgi:hypothetical protein